MDNTVLTVQSQRLIQQWMGWTKLYNLHLSITTKQASLKKY